MRLCRYARLSLDKASVAILFLLALLPGSSKAQAPQFAIGTYHLQSSARYSLTQYDYVYTADLTNNGAAAQGVVGTVTSSSPNTLIIKGQVNFGLLAAGATLTSTDTFTLRQDRRYSFDPASLNWSFSQLSGPTANAGPAQTARLGQTVTLNGAGSTDPTGHALTYQWTIVSEPAGSAATLLNPTSPMPSFTVDVFGNYVVQLVVNNGSQSSAPSAVTISTTHTAPTANAGPNQTAAERATVQLDGSGSIDPDGNTLTYSWSLVSVPAGSTAALSSSTAVRPILTLDKFGSYVAQLIVSDAYLSSAPSTVTITTTHTAPVAIAGPAQSVPVGTSVTLDGSTSQDSDGFPLTYAWSLLSIPSGSSASLANPTSVHPSFTVDRVGSYVAQLIVNDGFNSSAPNTVTISTQTLPPTANAGPMQTVAYGSTVQLDGTASSDPNGLALTYSWSLLSKPAGSGAALSNATTARPTFAGDKPGTYVAQLMVADSSFMSVPATVTIVVSASTPTANAGANQTVVVGATVTLNGAASSDPGGATLTYLWTFLSTPGAVPVLNNASSVSPSFVAATAGIYTLQLVVNNGTNSSQPATVQITAAVGALSVSPASLTFPDTTVGASSPYQTVTVTNTSSAPVSFSGIGATGDFANYIRSTCGGAPLAAGATCTVGVTFSPTAVGPRTGSLVLYDNAGNTPQTVALSGNGLGQQIALLLSNPLIDVGGTLTGTVTLPVAITSVATIMLTSSNPAAVTVSPATVIIQPGQSSANFSYTGVAAGTAILTASGSGLTTATAQVTATASAITLAAPSSVIVGQTVSVSFRLGNAAPAGGVTVSFTSSNPAVATISSSVFVPAGATTPTANPQLTAIAAGTVQLTASAPGFAPGSQSVSVVAPIATLSPASITVNQGLTYAATLSLSAPAPAGGTTFTLRTDSAAVATVPASVMISAGNTSATVTITAVAAGATTLRANAPGIAEADAVVTVTAPAMINTTYSQTLGNNTSLAISFSLTAPAPAAQPLTVTSNDPTHFVLSTSPLTIGSASITVPLTAGSQMTPTLYLQGQNYSGTAAINSTLTISSSGFAPATEQVVLQPSGFAFGVGQLNTSTTAANSPVTVYLVSLDPTTLAITGIYSLAPQAGPVTVTVTSSSPAVGTVLQSPTTIPVGSQSTQGLTFHPLAAGTTNLLVTPPAGFTAPSLTAPPFAVAFAQETVTVQNSAPTPAIGIFSPTVGNNTVQPLSLYLTVAPSTNQSAVVTSSDPAHFLLSTSPTTVGSASVTLALTAGSTTVPPIYIEGLNFTGKKVISATLTATTAGFVTGTASAGLYPTGFGFFNSGGNVTTFAPDVPLPVSLVLLDPGTLSLFSNSSTMLGPQAGSVSLVASSSSPAVGAVLGSPLTLSAGQSSTISGLSFEPYVAGTTTVTLIEPAGFSTPSVSPVLQVPYTVQPSSVTQTSQLIVGNESYAPLALTFSPPRTDVPLTITSNDPVHFLLSTNPALVGTASVTVPLSAGSTTLPKVYVQGQGYTGTSAITGTLSLSANGYVTQQASASLYPTGFGAFSYINLTTTSPSQTIMIDFDILNPGTLTSIGSTFLGPQAGSVSVSATNSAPAVAALVGGPAIFVYNSFFNQAFTVQPITAGSTTVTFNQPPGFYVPNGNQFGQVAVTVTAPQPTITLTSQVVGNNSIANLGVTFTGAVPASENVTFTVSDPSHFLLALNATDAGSASITVPLAAGTLPSIAPFIRGFNYLGNTAITATLTASAPGYSDAMTTVSLYPTGLAFVSSQYSSVTGSSPISTPVSLYVLTPGTLVSYRGVLTGVFPVPLAPQAAAIPVVIANADPTIGTLLGNPNSIQPSMGVTQGLQFQPLYPGLDTLTLTQPAGYYTPADLPINTRVIVSGP